MPTYRYHWTPRSNLASIAVDGLDPSRARGKLRVVWCCEETRVAWAVGHVAKHHECSPDDMVLLRLRVDGLATRATSWPACTLLTGRVPPHRICGVRSILSTRWESIRHYVPRKKKG